MKFIGNIFWFVLGGFLTALMYWLAGFLFCITIVGIPFGAQLMKFGTFALWPFGRKVEDGKSLTGFFNLLFNVLWIILGWWEIAATHLAFGILCCITIVGIPFGIQHFKLAWLSLMPFGKKIV